MVHLTNDDWPEITDRAIRRCLHCGSATDGENYCDFRCKDKCEWDSQLDRERQDAEANLRRG